MPILKGAASHAADEGKPKAAKLAWTHKTKNMATRRRSSMLLSRLFCSVADINDKYRRWSNLVFVGVVPPRVLALALPVAWLSSWRLLH